MGLETAAAMVVLPAPIFELSAIDVPIHRVRQTRQAFDTMREFMNSHVQGRREAMNSSADDDTSKDILSLFVRASEHDEDKRRLDNEELVHFSKVLEILLLNGHRRSGIYLRCYLPVMVRFGTLIILRFQLILRRDHITQSGSYSWFLIITPIYSG
jgi:hypothetical protein